jgi:hypothetical protein
VFALGGFLELLRDEELDDATRREFFATMSEQVDRLASWRPNCSNLSRADADGCRVRRERGRSHGGGRRRRREFAALSVAAAGRWSSMPPMVYG